jgi:hypothetical protein
VIAKRPYLTSTTSSSSDSSTTRLARPFLGAAFFAAGFCLHTLAPNLRVLPPKANTALGMLIVDVKMLRLCRKRYNQQPVRLVHSPPRSSASPGSPLARHQRSCGYRPACLSYNTWYNSHRAIGKPYSKHKRAMRWVQRHAMDCRKESSRLLIDVHDRHRRARAQSLGRRASA